MQESPGRRMIEERELRIIIKLTFHKTHKLQIGVADTLKMEVAISSKTSQHWLISLKT
jgi:hypothetical protein